MSNCPKCGKTVEYYEAHCRCGEFVGYPNHRAAMSEREALEKRYQDAQDDAKNRKVLEDLAENSLPVISMSVATCDNILRSDKYRNYDERVESGERTPANVEDHVYRSLVGERMFPMYHEHIHYAVLSPNGQGLDSYGSIAICWRVTEHYLGRRASLLDENSYTFYSRHNLGNPNSSIPPGHRAVWGDRSKLVVGKLAEKLKPGIVPSELLLHSGGSREKDEFVEVAIYAEKGVDTQDVCKVTLHSHPSVSEDQSRLKVVREICGRRNIEFIE